MILIDTSAWIDFFRDGPLAEAVELSLDAADSALCGPVYTEVLRGLRRPKENAKVRALLAGCHWLEQPDELWRDAGDLGQSLKAKGANVKTLDLLIATYALAHHVPLLSADADFRLMKKHGLDLHLL